MYYDSMSDMFIDNRNGLKKSLVGLGACEEIVDEALQAFDWAAMQALDMRDSYSLLYKSVRKVSKLVSIIVDKRRAKRIAESHISARQYFKDVQNGKLVGYSLAETADDCTEEVLNESENS